MISKINSRHFFIFFPLLLSLVAGAVYAQNAGPNPKYQLITGNDFVQEKNYYLLTLFQQLPAVKKMLETDEVLAGITKTKNDSLTAALSNCGRDGYCYLERMKFTETEIKAVGERLSVLYQPQNALGKLVQGQTEVLHIQDQVPVPPHAARTVPGAQTRSEHRL